MMLSEVMESLSRALYTSIPLALGASFIWGLLSMVLSPCHLVSVPLVLGVLTGREEPFSRARQVRLALVFTLGMTVSVGFIGIVTSLSGRIVGDIGPIGKILVASMLIYVGLSLSDLIRLPLPGVSQSRQISRKGVSGALLMGLILGAALGPCTFAFMAPVLALMFQLGSERLGQAIALGICFAIGHGVVVAVAGAYADRIQKLLDWSGTSRTARIFRITCGLLVVAGGLYLILPML